MTSKLGTAAIAVATVLSVSSTASPTFIGLEVVDITDNDDGLMEYAVYAVFDDPTDVLLNVFNANVTSTTGFFHNSIGGMGQSALPFTEFESSISDNPDADSFVTIGLMTGDDNMTMLDQGFDEQAFISGDNLGSLAGWFAFPLNDQGVPINGLLLISVFTPLNDANGIPGIVSGSLTVGYTQGGPPLFGTGSFFIPAPGSLALLALAAFTPRSRRRARSA